MTRLQKYDLYSQGFKEDTFKTYATMRQSDPIFCQPDLDGETMIWFVTQYDLVTAILSDDQQIVRDGRSALTPERLAASPPQPPISNMIASQMLNRDGDDHHKFRRLVSRACTPRMVSHLIKRTDVVIQTIGAADRDPARFPNPDVRDIDRNTSGHLAVERDIHYCLGAALVRLEEEIAIKMLFARLLNL